MDYGKQVAIERKRHLIPAAVIFAAALMGLLPVLTAFAQTTYVITDGSRVLVHTTSATDPKAVLGEAGLQLGMLDTYSTQEGDSVQEIRVQRGQRISLDYHGRQMEVLSAGESVGELLDRLELQPEDSDAVSVPLTAETYDGMVLTVGKVIEENQIYTTVLPHETIRCSDATLPEGERKVLTEGEDGQLLCEAAVTYLNGRETHRRVLSRQVVTQPVSEIIAVGTGTAKADAEKKREPVIDRGLITLPSGEVLTYIEKVTCLATAYTCEGYVGTTATGTRARVGAIAVDPEVFPYGTRFFIQTRDGEYIYGIATAEDCGSKEFIYGTRLDLYFNTKKECIQFGARSCDVYILG